MLSKLVQSLEIEEYLYPSEKYYMLESKYKEVGLQYLVNKWFAGEEVIDIWRLLRDKSEKEIERYTNNVYNAGILCTYLEKRDKSKDYIIPTAFKDTMLSIINGTEINLPKGNLTFYLNLYKKIARDKGPNRKIGREQLMRAAMASGHDNFYQKGGFYNKVLEQGLLKKVSKEFIWSSRDIGLTLSKHNNLTMITDKDIIESRFIGGVNQIVPLWQELVNLPRRYTSELQQSVVKIEKGTSNAD